MKGIPPAVLASLKTALMEPDENGITLSCSEYSGKVTCDSLSAALQSAGSPGEFFSPDITVQAVNIIEGGKAVTLGGIQFVVTESYSATWTKEYGDSFTTYDGRVIKPLKGIRFSLGFSTKGVPPDVLTELVNALMNPDEPETDLSCSEYSGKVICDNFTGSLQTAGTPGEYFGAEINVTAVSASVPEDGL